jgi:hypothetical protein
MDVSNRQIQASTFDPMQPDAGEAKPYAPSYLDRFMGWVQRLPLPYWLTYLLLFILQSSIGHVLSWYDGWLPAFTFSPLLLVFPLWFCGPLAIMTFLNTISVEALSVYGPLLDASPEMIQRLKYEFTTMPARGVIISGFFWAGLYLIFTYLAYDTVLAAFQFGTFFLAIQLGEGLITFFISGPIYYHSIRQLVLVNRTVKMISRINLFQLDPVYAFSTVTSRTGISWVILLSLTLLLFPIRLALVPVLSMLIAQVVLAVSAFALPLWAVNHCLVAEKRRLLEEHNRHVELALARLHQHLADNDLGEIVQLNSAIAGLYAERDILTRIPTWPWRADLFTAFLSIVVLPVILFLIQFALTRWLGS